MDFIKKRNIRRAKIDTCLCIPIISPSQVILYLYCVHVRNLGLCTNYRCSIFKNMNMIIEVLKLHFDDMLNISSRASFLSCSQSSFLPYAATVSL